MTCNSSLRTLGFIKTLRGYQTVVFSVKRGRPQFESATSRVRNDASLIQLTKLIAQKQLYVVSSIDSQQVLLREYELEASRGQNIQAALSFQAETQLPYSIEEALLVLFSQKKCLNKISTSVFSTKKELIKAHLIELNAIGIDPEAVSCTPAALVSFNDFLPTNKGLRLIIYLAEGETTCVLVRDGELLGSKCYPIGERAFFEAITNETGLSDEEGINLMYTFVFSSEPSKEFSGFYLLVDDWKIELTKAVLSLISTIRGQEIEMILTGELAANPSINALFQKNLGFSFKELQGEIIEGFSLQFLKAYAASIGLSAAFLTTASGQANFRVEELVFNKPFKHLKKTLTLYFSLVLALSFLIFSIGEIALKRQEEGIRKKIKIMETTNDNVPVENSAQKLSFVKPQDLRKQIYSLTDKKFAAKSPYPLQPQLPRVSSFLSWLSSHPLLVCADEEEKIVVERLSYSMLQRPDKSKPSERYRVKVDFEFTSDSPKRAREFHESLLKSNEIINPQDQFQWSVSASRYRVSCYLKDKTFYY